jgi:hypothetical protein
MLSLASALAGACALPAAADSRLRDDGRDRLTAPGVHPEPNWTGSERRGGWTAPSRDEDGRGWSRDEAPSGWSRTGEVDRAGWSRGPSDWLSPWQVRRILRDQGFVRVDITHQRGALAGATAIDWRGRPVRLRIDMTSGRVLRAVRLEPAWGGGWSGDGSWPRPW